MKEKAISENMKIGGAVTQLHLKIYEIFTLPTQIIIVFKKNLYYN